MSPVYCFLFNPNLIILMSAESILVSASIALDPHFSSLSHVFHGPQRQSTLCSFKIVRSLVLMRLTLSFIFTLQCAVRLAAPSNRMSMDAEHERTLENYFAPSKLAMQPNTHGASLACQSTGDKLPRHGVIPLRVSLFLMMLVCGTPSLCVQFVVWNSSIGCVGVNTRLALDC